MGFETHLVSVLLHLLLFKSSPYGIWNISTLDLYKPSSYLKAVSMGFETLTLSAGKSIITFKSSPYGIWNTAEQTLGLSAALI